MLKRDRAFTLIELLVVVSIIALLVSILLPALSRARNVTKKSMCLSNMRQVIMGVMMYAYDNNDWVPDGRRFVNDTTPGAYHFPDYGLWDSNHGWFGIGRLYDQEYLTDHNCFYCPATQTVAKGGIFSLKNEWEDRNGGILIRGNILHRGAFDWRLNAPENAQYTQANMNASYAFTPGQRPYAMLNCFTNLDTLKAHPAGHLLLKGRSVAFSDGGVSWIPFTTDAQDTVFLSGYKWREFEMYR